MNDERPLYSAMSSAPHSSLITHHSSFFFRGLAAITFAVVLLHVVIAAQGGLIAPAETDIAIASGPGDAGRETAADASRLLEPPLARWLATGGLAVAGRSAIGARLLPVLASALLLLGCGAVALRFHGPRAAAWIVLAMSTTPLCIARLGQVSTATLTAASLGLAAVSLAALASVGGARPRWLAPVAGCAIGVAILSGGPTGAAIATLMVLGHIAVSQSAPGDRDARTRWIGGGLAAAGAIMMVASLRHGGTGWPSAASLYDVRCPLVEGEHGADGVWLGTALAAAGLVVARVRTARSLGLGWTALVAVVIGLPWFLLTWASAPMETLCTSPAVQAPVAIVSAPEIADRIKDLGAGVFPWMAFLPLGLLRLRRWIVEPANLDAGGSGGPEQGVRSSEEPVEPAGLGPLGSVLAVWVAASVCTLLASSPPASNALVACAAALACMGGLAFSSRAATGEPLAERTACAAGALLLLMVFKDLLDDPGILLSAIGLSTTAGTPEPRIAVIAGGLGMAGVGVIALRGAVLGERWPAALRRLVSGAESTGRALALASVLACALALLSQTVVPVMRASSWAGVISTYQRLREDGERLFAFRELGGDAELYGDARIEVLDGSGDLRRALGRRRGRVFLATRTLYYRQLSETIGRITGERPRVVEGEQRQTLLAVYDGPRPDDVSRPAPTVDAVPRELSRGAEMLASGAVELVGAGVLAERARPGDTVGIVLYLRARARIETDLTANVSLVRQESSSETSFPHEPTDGVWPTSRWRPGEVVVDRLEVVVPEDAAAGDWELLVEMLSERQTRDARRRIGTIRIEE